MAGLELDLDLISLNFVLEFKRHELKKLLKGTVVARGSPRYLPAVGQYAFTSHFEDMAPSFIIYPKDEQDIKKTLDYATKERFNVAVRTGGHQYSGASSTKGGILLDLSATFKQFDVAADGLVTMGISFRLGDLNSKLAEHNLFVPHGQCAHVHVGGHAHTGGYGNSCRGFGLFGDHFTAIKVITADGHDRWIERGTPDSDESELFYAVLGGSPGNYAILTHIKLQALNSDTYPHARGLRITAPYTRRAMRALLQVKADMASESKLPIWRCGKELPPDYDMCITVLSIGVPGLDLTPTARKHFDLEDFEPPGQHIAHKTETRHPFDEKVGLDKDEFAEFQNELEAKLQAGDFSCWEKPGRIIVWAQWANVNGQPPEKQEVPPGPWFDAIKTAAGDNVMVNDWQGGPQKGEGLSFLTGQWTWPIKREFIWPYNKRTYVTNSTTLNTSGWVDVMVERIEAALDLDSYKKGARLAMQVFHFGGSAARFITNPQKHDTAYSWRDDTTVQLVMDCFYVPTPTGKQFAEDWQKENDKVFKGVGSSFAPNMDRRVLWGSYAATEEEKSLDAAHRFYYEDEEKYKKLQRIKTTVDPNNLLTPNTFAIRAVPSANAPVASS